MSSVDRVVDYLAGMPQMASHRQTYATEFVERGTTTSTTEIDGFEIEKKAIPDGEKEIIRRLQLQDKFTRSGFWREFDLNSMVDFGGNRQVKRSRTDKLSFASDVQWFLNAAESRAIYANRESTMHLLDAAQKRKIMAKCPTLSEPESSGIWMTAIHERLSVPVDMRHMFMKMYLLLQDFTLAVTSKSEDMQVATNLGFNLMSNVTDAARLSAVSEHDVVVDAELFTKEQLSLLALAGEQYPSVWYAGDNIYNQCQMQADDLIILSDKEIKIEHSFNWGSPDRMYQLMWTIAAKMDCVGCLVSVIENMRGKCSLARSLFSRVESNEINSMVPTSFSLSLAFGRHEEKFAVANMPGYVSTSLSLVADLMYGMLFEGVASCVVESLGAIGTLLSSKTPSTNPTINGLFRDFGLQHTSAEYNYMLRNWELLAGRPITWEFGKHLKEYGLALAGEISNGVDIKMPQLLLTLSSFTAVNTAIGMAKGWYGPKANIDMDKSGRINKSDGLAALGWLTGLRACRPQVFFNRSGKRNVLLGPDEQHLSAELLGDFKLHGVSFWIGDSLGGRVDENEESTGGLFRTEFSGTRCSLVYSYAEEKWVEEKPIDYDKYVRQTLRGHPPDPVPEVEVSRPTLQPSAINWGARPTMVKEKAFEHLRNLNRGNAIVVSKEPRHTRTNSTGEPYVPRYIVDGDVSTRFMPSEKSVMSEGEEIRFAEVDVPGDGQCGVHAVVKDLQVHARVAAGDVKKTEEIFTGELSTNSFHDAQEMAALCQKWGFGMNLIDKDTGRVTQYNDGTQDHNVTIVKEGQHFKAGILGIGEKKMRITKVDRQESPSQEFIEKVESYGQLFSK